MLAERQWGVVSVRQLRALGVAPGAVKHQVAVGRLRPLHRGVYAVGHAALRPEGRWLAAVLACGEGAVLSHRSAAALWGLRSTAAVRVDVTAPRSRGVRPGIDVHRTRGLAPEDVATRRAIPVTSPARTLLDLAAALAPGDLESAVARASQMRLVDAAALESVLARGGGHRGRGRLARVVAAEPRVTRSQLERRFLRLVREAGLPEPETNVWVTLGGGEEWQLDVLWRRRRVSVELDGWEHHRTRRRFEADRARSVAMQAAGYRHLQLTWRQLTTDEPSVVHALRTLLGSRGPT